MASKAAWWKVVLRAFGALLILILIICCALRIALTPGVLTRLVNKYAPVALDSTGISIQAGRIALELRPCDLFKGKLGIDLDSVAVNYEDKIHADVFLDAAVQFGRDSLGEWFVRVPDLSLDADYLHLDADLQLGFPEEGIGLRGKATLPGVDVARLLEDYVKPFWSDASKVRTNAVADLRLDVDGVFLDGSLPAFSVCLDVPKSRVEYSGVDIAPDVVLSLRAAAPQGGDIEAEVKRLLLSARGLDASASGKASKLLSDNGPAVELDAAVKADVREMAESFAKDLGMQVSGLLDADVHLKTNLSTFDIYNLNGNDIKARADLSSLRVVSEEDTLDAFVNRLSLKAGLMENRFRRSRRASAKDNKCLAAKVGIDTLHLCYGSSLNATGKKIDAFLQTSAESVTVSDTVKYNPLRALVKIGSLFYEGGDSLSLRLKDSRNTFKIHPTREGRDIVVVDLSSKNRRIRLRSGFHRLALADLNLGARGKMVGLHKKNKVKSYADSLYALHPGWTRDSLAAHWRMSRRAPAGRKAIQDELSAADITFDLGSSFRRLMRNWDVLGSVRVGRCRVMSPAFPQRTAVRSFKASFNNDRVSVDTLHIVSGASGLWADGSVSNLRKVLMRKGMVKAALDVKADSLDITQLLAVYARGQKNMENLAGMAAMDTLDDDSFETSVVDSSSASGPSMIVVPGNLDARVSLRGRNISFSDLKISQLNTLIRMKRRTAQVTGLRAKSNMGDVFASAFYSSKRKDDLSAGFDLGFRNISAGQIISLMPQIDTLMPLLKSFDGMLNCTLTATSQLDTNMTLKMPSLDGVLRVSGSDLNFHDSKEIARIARLLLFKNPKRATIDTMTVEGVIKDNKLEIFPFLLKMDRWQLALAGVQGMDSSFKYHVSLVKTPLPFRFGANISGPDFDNISFKLGKAIYKNGNLPVFTKAIDTARVNLVTSIRTIFEKGVEKAVRENRRSDVIARHRRSIRYDRSAADMQMEELSSSERKAISDSTAAADSASMAVKLDTIAVKRDSIYIKQ